MRRVLGLLLLAVVLMLPVLAGPATAGPTHEKATASRSRQVAYAQAAVKATNRARTTRGHAALKHSDCLARKAWAQAHKMARQHRMFHQRLGPIMRGCGMQWAGENVAYGYSTGTRVVTVGWMHSPPHRANILSKHYRLVAVGAVRGSDGLWYVSQVFGRKA